MEKEFNLSEKIEFEGDGGVDWLKVEDVKEFIKLLKEKLIRNMYQRSFKSKNHVHPLIPTDIMEEIIKRKINQLTGAKLI